MFLALAQGLNVIYGFTGYLPFGYVGFFGAGAYGFALAVMHLHWPPLAAMAAAGVAALLLAASSRRCCGCRAPISPSPTSPRRRRSIRSSPIPALEDITKGPYGVSLSSVFAPMFSYHVGVAILPFSLVRRGLAAQLALRPGAAGDPRGPGQRRDGRRVGGARAHDRLAALGADRRAGRRRVRLAHLGVLSGHRVRPPVSASSPSCSRCSAAPTTLIGPLLGVVILYGVYNTIGITVPQYFQLIYGALIVALVLFLPNGLVSLLTRRGIRVP